MTTFSAQLALTWIAVACGGSRWPTPRVPQVTPASSTGTVVGAVVAWQDGHPIEAATVELRLQTDSGLSGESPIAIRTDATGVFSMSSLLPGEYWVGTRAVGYLPLTTLCQVQAGQVDTLILMLDVQVAGPIQVRPTHDQFAKVRPRGRHC
jgi:Carboxypeptidase regulatory-like domain